MVAAAYGFSTSRVPMQHHLPSGADSTEKKQEMRVKMSTMACIVVFWTIRVSELTLHQVD